MSAEHTPTPPAPADDARARIDEDGCCVGCGRSVQPSPCCPDYPADDAKRCCESPVLLCATCGTAQGYGGPADDATRGCTVAFCETHRDVEIVPGPFCPSCLGSDCRVDGMRDGLRARRADDASGAEAWARRFHDAYERLAPSFGYETRKETRQFDPSSPNGKLMIAVCAALPLPARDDAVEEAARALIESVPPDFWNNDPPTDDTEVAYAIDYALLDALRAALRREKGGDK